MQSKRVDKACEEARIDNLLHSLSILVAWGDREVGKTSSW